MHACIHAHTNTYDRALQGAILSVQFIAVIPGNMVLGYLTDIFGSRRVLQLAILGDAVCFFATAFCSHPVALLCVRFCAVIDVHCAFMWHECVQALTSSMPMDV